MDHRAEAWEEIKILQDIIHKQEDLRTKTKNWCIALFGGLSIAFANSNGKLDFLAYLLASIILVCIFWLLENLQRSIQMTTICHRNSVEESLLSELESYKGPKIGKTFSAGYKFLSPFNLRLSAVYLGLIIIALSLSFFQQ